MPAVKIYRKIKGGITVTRLSGSTVELVGPDWIGSYTYTAFKDEPEFPHALDDIRLSSDLKQRSSKRKVLAALKQQARHQDLCVEVPLVC
ncbi:hypothetical protein EDD90_1789 [Streptomyces sp. Ag109_O5-1]|nr:hypothetical protein EDD90_1789 [Streptomyces sp. Ag109_O5-1]